MTYKLFDTTLAQHEAGRLVRFMPALDPDESDLRTLVMPKSLATTLAQNDPKKARDFAANIRAFLGRFVKGREVDNCDYMKSWKDDVFELRVQNQRRGERLRIFGAFGRPDVFVALFRKYRHEFGDRDDPRWDVAIARAVREWDELFPGCRRVPSKPFSNCVTSNAIEMEEC